MSDQLTAEAMKGLNIKGLRTLLQRQHEEKRRLQDRRSEVGAGLSVAESNIHIVRKRIAEVSDAEPVQVSDHAVLRYLQRICGLDIDAVTSALDTSELRECIRNCPTGRHTINDVIYVTKDRLLVTLIYEDHPPCIEPIPTINGSQDGIVIEQGDVEIGAIAIHQHYSTEPYDLLPSYRKEELMDMASACARAWGLSAKP